MSYLIVSDTSSNKFTLPGVNYKTVPLHVRLGEEDWSDMPDVDMDAFDHAIDTFKGNTSSACPSPDEWLEAFGDAECIFCHTISQGLSGSYNSVMVAKQMYEEQHPDRKVYVIDSLGAGARQTLHIYKLIELLEAGTEPEEAYEQMLAYRDKTDILYTLESLKMLASAGRCSHLVAKAIGVLDVRVIGTASPQGTIVVVDKKRGFKKSILATFDQMLQRGYNGGKVVMCHNRNDAAMELMTELIRAKFPDAWIDIHKSTVLCSYYEEKGGFIIGFEI